MGSSNTTLTNPQLPDLRAAPVAIVEIHGASALWREVPEAMAQAVELLEQTVARLLADYRGARLQARGADLAARFGDVVDAVEWTLALSDALVEIDWPKELLAHRFAAEVLGPGEAVLFRGLRISAGIDVGVIHLRVAGLSGQRFAVGPVLEAAAELARQAPQGCAELGPAAVDLMAEEGEPRATIVPDRLAEYLAGGEAPAGVDERHSNLPDFDAAFVDRVSEFNALAEAIGRARHIAICGPAGAGKSRLAVEFAREWLSHHREQLSGGARGWFCDLSETRTVQEAVFAVARTTSVQIPASEALAELDERLIAAFGERGPILLILDDTDSLPPGFTDSIERWIEHASNLYVLTTCRRQPQEGCDVVTVDALGRSSARALLENLLERPPAVPTDARAAHLRDPERLFEVVDACGRLPLALELVARSRPNRSTDIGSDAEGFRDQGPRDQLERALDRSWQMLDADQQAALQACTVFAGSFSAEAAISLIGATVDADADELFSVLCQFSLLRSSIRPDRPARHVVLAPVRDFVVTRADEALLEAARDQHMRHFADLARVMRRELRGASEREWLEHARAELPNFYRAADHARHAAPELLVSIVEGLTEMNIRIGPLGGFGERTDDALAAARELGEPGLILRALRVQDQTLMWAGRYDAAEPVAREAHELARGLEDQASSAYTLSSLGFVLGMLGKEDEGFPMVRQAAEQVRGDDSYEAITVLSNAGLVARNRNEIDEATGYLHRALVLARKCENPFSQASVLFFLGTILRHQQQWGDALGYLLEAHTLFESIGDRRGRLVCDHEIAACYVATDQIELAESCFAEAMELAAAMGDRVHTAVSFLGRGRARFARGEYAAAESDLLEASIQVENAGHIQLKMAALLYLAAAYAALEHIGEAQRCFERVEQIFEETDITRERPLFEVMYGYLEAAHARAAMRRGDHPEARRRLRAAYERADVSGVMQRASHAAANLEAYLDERVEAGELPAGVSPRRAVLRVCEETRWFAVDDADPVDISRRGPIRRILRALVEKRLEAPGETMTSDELLEQGWPGEVMTAQSGAQRLYTTISRMRGLGLQDVLETFDGEYLIAQVYTPVWVERSAK